MGNHLTDTQATLATRDDAFQAVRAHLRQQLASPDLAITPDDRLDLLPGADSVRLMRTIACLEQAYVIEFDDTAITNADTVDDVVTLLWNAARPGGGVCPSM